MKFRNYTTTLPELKKGESYFVVRYSGFGVGFRITIAAKDVKDARTKAENQLSYAASIHSIRKGNY